MVRERNDWSFSRRLLDRMPMPPFQAGRALMRVALFSLLLVLMGILAWVRLGAQATTAASGSATAVAGAPREATRAEVERACAQCHAYAPPELFPDFLWPHEVERGLKFLKQAGAPPDTPSFASLVAYYRNRAPASLPVLKRTEPPHEPPVRFERKGYRLEVGSQTPALANVRFMRLSDDTKLDIVACDMVNGYVMLLQPYQANADLRIVADTIPNPAHAEVVDLDRNGIKDLLVANLGSATPTDERVGSVEWLRGRPDGSYKPITLATKLGRVADVEAADFDGDGDLDLLVAEFGWLKTGSVVLLENRTSDAEKPVFVASTIDGRHGAIHVPVADLNGDGRPDFVALFSQEHEVVVAFLNRGGNRFEREVIYQAPHPAFGSSGIQLVDLDRDGDLDALLTNGDSMDSQLLRPYHGIQWLENRGSYPFEYHHLTAFYGAHRAQAADIDGDGDLDIVAASFLPGTYYERLRRDMDLDALILLEQVAPGRFVRHSLETATCDHATLDLGDFDADGKVDLVIGNSFVPFGVTPGEVRAGADSLKLWSSLGKKWGPAAPAD
jgi:hypothetical protein